MGDNNNKKIYFVLPLEAHHAIYEVVLTKIMEPESDAASIFT